MSSTGSVAKRCRILFIGNSFTMGAGDDSVMSQGGVPRLVAELAAAAGHPMPETRLCAKGGKGFCDHLTDETGAMTAIREGGWDVVVLQEHSMGPTQFGDVARFLEDGMELRDAILATSPEALILLYETWAREASHPLVSGDKRTFADGATQMQEELGANYAELARQLGGRTAVAPAGDAWSEALRQRPRLRLHADDDYHANRNGSYLSALAIMATVWPPLPDSLPPLAGVDSADAAFLRGVVRGVMRRG